MGLQVLGGGGGGGGGGVVEVGDLQGIPRTLLVKSGIPDEETTL